MSKKKYLTREDILNADDRPIREIDVPEWGGTVRVRALDAEGRWRLMMSASDSGGKLPVDWEAKILALCICDESGQRMFEEKDAASLLSKSAAAYSRVATICREISRLDTEDTIEDIRSDFQQSQN